MNALRIALTGLPLLLVAAEVATAQTPAAPGVTASHHAASQTAGKAAAAPLVAAPAGAHAQKPKATAAAAASKAAAKPAVAPKPGTTAESPIGAAEEPPKGAAAEAPKGGAAELPKGSVTGMPLPRWASLKSDEVNLRKGPGTRYPIEWVYRRHDLPVQIEREYKPGGWSRTRMG